MPAAMASLSTVCPALRTAPSVCGTSYDRSFKFSSVQHLRAFARRVPWSVALRAGNSSGVEPDLDEEFRDPHATAGEDLEEFFPYGQADGAHSWHKGDDGTWWEGIKEVFESSGGPTGAQGAISWLFIPGLIAGVVLDFPQDYLFLYTILFIFAFIGMEMAKPSKESHFEPDMYNLKK